MEDMVDAVDHDRRRLVAEIENALDPQQVLRRARCADSASQCETAIQSSGSSNASTKLVIPASWL